MSGADPIEEEEEEESEYVDEETFTTYPEDEPSTDLAPPIVETVYEEVEGELSGAAGGSTADRHGKLHA